MLGSQAAIKFVVIVAAALLLSIIAYFVLRKKAARQNTALVKTAEFWFLLGAAILFSFLPRLRTLEMLFTQPAEPLFPLTIFVLLPMLYAGRKLGRSAAIALSVVVGFFQFLFFTKNVFTLFFWITIGLVWVIVMDIRSVNHLRHSKLNVNILLPVAILWVASGSIIFFCLVLSGAGTIADVLWAAFVNVWKQWLLFSLLLVINGGILFLIYLYGGTQGDPSTTNKNLVSQGDSISRPQSKYLMTIVPCVLLLVILLCSFVWRDMEQRTLKMLQMNSRDIGTLVLDDYQFYLESGGALIHQFSNMLVSDGTTEAALNQLFTIVPYFSEIDLIENGEVVAHVSLEEQATLPEFIVYSVSQVQGTTLPYRREVVPHNGGSIYYYLSPIKQSNRVLVGVSRGLDHPFMESSIHAMSGLPGEMILVDDLGGGIYPQYAFDDRNDIIQFISELSAMPPQGFFADEAWNFVASRELGNMKIVMLHRVSQSEVNQFVFSDSKRALFSIFLIGTISILIMVVYLRNQENKVRKTLDWFRELEQFQYTQPPEVRDLVISPVVNEAARVAKSIYERVNAFENQYAVLKGLGDQSNIYELVQYVLQSSLFTQVDAIRFVLIPELSRVMPNGGETRFGVGRLSVPFSAMDDLLLDGMKKQNFRFVRDTSKTRIPLMAEGRLPGTFAAQTLRHGDTFLGIVWIANASANSFRDGLIQSFTLVAEETSRSMASFYFLHQVQMEKIRIESIIHSIPEPVLVFDQENNLVVENSSAQQLQSNIRGGTGITDHLMEVKLLPLLKQMSRDGVNNNEITFSSGKVYSVVMSKIKGTGNPSEDWVVCTFHDVSDYEKKDEMRSEFLETVGQYIQMPLKMATGYIGMLDTVGDINPAQKEYINAVANNLKEMDRFVNGVLDINRIAAGIGIQREICFGTEILNEIITRIMPSVRQRKIMVHADTLPPKAITKFEADSTLFSQALYNVLDNAVKFNRLGGTIAIGIGVDIEGVTFTIQDTGIGIAPLDVPHIFDGLSGKHTTTGEGHSKIGMALTKSIIDRHGGTINVNSVLGKGSTFTIWMPKKQ